MSDSLRENFFLVRNTKEHEILVQMEPTGRRFQLGAGKTLRIKMENWDGDPNLGVSIEDKVVYVWELYTFSDNFEFEIVESLKFPF